MNDILDLPGWAVLSKRLDAGEYEIEAEYTVLPTACQKCGVIGRLYKHGTKNTTYRDSPIRGHAVRLLARVQRYKCRECGETFLQPLDGMQDSRLMTKRCAEFIQRQCLIDTFLRISENVGCDEKTVRALAGERIESEASSTRRNCSCTERSQWCLESTSSTCWCASPAITVSTSPRSRRVTSPPRSSHTGIR